ncbi:SRPBCC family protein [Bdellovibrio sp. HCB274]|uniref:SRPBCC family protein n=1 Tax=Bdellovibrio sp. HCB274 TaxID=3394361 RepID=UPI0039B3AD26
MTYPSRQISVSINRTVGDVYDFAANPENMNLWAQGLSRAKLIKSGEEWVAASPMGNVKIRFSPKNNFGVLDHDVTLPSGVVNHNPLRVVKNGEGSEVIFTLYRLPKVSDADFEKDQSAVLTDLKALKSILEK